MIHLDLHGFIPSGVYRETMWLALDLIEEKKLTRLLGNLKDMGKMPIQDAQWREEIWFPRFVKSTIRKAAIVMSDDHFNVLSFNETIKALDKNSATERRLFSDLDKAMLWLKENGCST